MRGGATLLAVAAVLMAPGLATGAAAQVRSIAFTANNDGFAFWTPPNRRTDWYYTHGMAVEAVLAWSPGVAALLGGGADGACPADGGAGAGPCALSRVTVGQDIYTPSAVFSYHGEATDRPYAGWLYVDLATARVAPGSTRSLGVQLGVTGGASMAGPLHRWFHRRLGKEEPYGWEHQIPFEPAFLVRGEARGRWPLSPDEPTGVRFEPYGRLALGTLRTAATAGLTLTWGRHAGWDVDWIGPDGSAYAFFGLGLEGEAVARDLFLDGSTWKDGPATERMPWLGRIEARVQAGWEGLGLEFAATRTTREFRDQGRPHVRGALRVVIRP